MSSESKSGGSGGGRGGGGAGGRGKARALRKGLTRVRAFGRLKPLRAERMGAGVEALKRVAAFDEEAGTVTMGGMDGARRVRGSGAGTAGTKTFDHFHGVIGPGCTQARMYDTAAAPLVGQFLDGYDVDLIMYGQTGSGKTHTCFGPPHSMATAVSTVARVGESAVTQEDVLKEEHGIMLRAGFDILNAVEELNASSDESVVLHGAMVEISIMSLTDQTVIDLLNNFAPCFVDNEHHLQGARQIEIKTVADVVHLAAAVESRLTKGTRMNDSSSRTHCCTILTLTRYSKTRKVVQETRFQLFDLMGSERFRGSNSAHDTSKSSKSSETGWEGIFANLSLTSLGSAVDFAAQQRAAGRKPVLDRSLGDYVLTKLMSGSLVGGALTTMITCMSQSPRNGEETYLSLKFGGNMAKLTNKPVPQPATALDKALKFARSNLRSNRAIVSKGVHGRFQARREAEVSRWDFVVRVLSAFEDEADGADSGPVEKADISSKK